MYADEKPEPKLMCIFFIGGVHNKITKIRRAYVLIKFHTALMQTLLLQPSRQMGGKNKSNINKTLKKQTVHLIQISIYSVSCEDYVH